MKRAELLVEIERLRVAYTQHSNQSYSLGATTALDDVARWIRAQPRPGPREHPVPPQDL